MKTKKSILLKEKKDAMRAARELGYKDYYIAKLAAATSLTQLDNIMIDARRDW